MKLNDIYTYLDKTINLKKKKQETIIEPLEELSINNLDKIWDDLSNLKLESNKEINPWKLKGDFFDSLTKKWELSKKLNLKKKILNGNSFLWKIPLDKSLKNILIKLRYIKNKTSKINLVIWILILFLLLIIDLWAVLLLNNSWINKLENIQTLKVNQIESQIKSAKTRFALADILYKPFYLIYLDWIQNLKYIIKTGKETTYFLDNSFKIYNNAKGISIISDSIQSSKSYFIKIENNTKNINLYLAKVKLTENDKNYSKLSNIKILSSNFEKTITKINSNFEDFLNIIWHNGNKKYFVVFQNNDEIRATWWFMWSAWIIEIFKWNIKSFNKKDIYAYEWDINKTYKDKIIAPKWFSHITSSFWLRDSNYFIDFQKSANSINFFLQKWGYEIDWVIFINMSSLNKILNIVWPIELPWIKDKITSENFAEIMSILVEAKISKKWTLWTPKQVLFDFSKILEDKIKKWWNFWQYIKLILEEIKNREIVFVSFDKKENEILDSIWINWKIDYNSSFDFAYPIYTSIWWNKTDRYIDISYKKDIKQLDNCNVYTNLEIHLKHNYSLEDKNRILELMNKNWVESNINLLNIQGAWINKSFIRVLLPKNAIIESKLDGEIKKFENFSYVDFFSETKSSEESIYNIAYKLENNDCKTYDFKLYKQAWVRKYDLHINKNWINYIYTDIQNDFRFE